MKQLLFLFLYLLPCLAWAQYPSNGNQKITLGEQTTADGLIYRGVATNDTVRKPSIDTMAYMVLDTTTNIMWHYKKQTSNAWLRLNLLPSDTASMLTNYWRSGRFSGTLPVANGGTNATTLTANKVMVGNGTSEVLTPTNLHWDNTNSRLGINKINPLNAIDMVGQIRMTGATIASGLTKNINISGAQNFTDDEVISISASNVTFIMVSDNNTGGGALFFASYASGTVVKIADPSNFGSVIDLDGFVCVYKSANSATINIKNRLGSTKSITVSQITVGD